MSETEIKNLTEEDIIAIVTRELPHLVIEHPEIHDKFIDVMSDVFAKKGDHAVLLTEIKNLRPRLLRRSVDSKSSPRVALRVFL